jgi:hypothetical protein
MRSRVRFRVLPWGFFLQREDSHGDHGLGSLVELTFKAPPGTPYSYIAITSSGQRNCTSWASQPQKSVTLQPQPGGETTKSIRDMWWHWEKKKNSFTHSCTYLLNLLTHSLTHILTYSLTPCSTVLEKLTSLQPFKKFPALYVTRRFITAFTSARHLSL